MFNLTSRQARSFLQTVIKHMEVFKNDAEFGWTIESQDIRENIVIRTNKFDTKNSVKSFPCALRSSSSTIG